MRAPELTFSEKIWSINWGMVLLLVLIAGIGTALLYSAAGGHVEPWAVRHVARFGFGLALMLTLALVDIRLWLRLAYPIYGIAVAMLVAVDIIGVVGMGAQRWLDLYVIQLQPSELMKIAIVLALSRYYHNLNPERIGEILPLVPPLLMIVVPVILVMVQPDLGTAIMVLSCAIGMLFLAGVRLWKFAVGLVLTAGALPFAWSLLHDYQRNRLLTFVDPERDPLGAGYHILQSKIALGSGGIFGKGFLGGTQAHLDFLPEKQTDFVFTMLAEELGMVGALCLLALYVCVMLYGYAIAMRSRSQFGRLVALGLTITLFLYVFINIGMVIGVLPVVGIPLPLVSYGGTAMLTVLAACGLIMGVFIHRDVEIPRSGAGL